MNFEDELHDQLHGLADGVSVTDASAASIEERARKRTTRNRAALGLGAFVLVAGIATSAVLVTQGDDDTVEVAGESEEAADGDESTSFSRDSGGTGADAATSELAVGSSLPAGAPGEVNYGTLPFDVEVTETGLVSAWSIKVAGDRAYAQNDEGWLVTSTDLSTWTPLAIPDGLANEFGSIDGWVNAFDAQGDIVVAAVERWQNLVDEEEVLAAEEAGEVFVFDPCDAGRQSETAIYISYDRGSTWAQHTIADDRPDGRFHGGGAIPWIATDGTAVIAGTESFLSLNVECVLQDAGVDLRTESFNYGFGWDDSGVQLYGYDDEADEERIVASYPWDELGLNAAELESVTNGFREPEFDGFHLVRIGPDGFQSVVELDGGINEIIGRDGEFLISTWGDGPELIRSTDGGLGWDLAEAPGWLRQSSGDVLLAETVNQQLSISRDGGRTWTEVGAPGGTFVHNLAASDDYVVAVGEAGNNFDIPEPIEMEPFQITAELDGFVITVDVGADEREVTMTLFDAATGEPLVIGSFDGDTGPDGEDFDLGFVAQIDGIVEFRDPSGNVVATFSQADIEEAFATSDDDALIVEGAEGAASSGGAAESGGVRVDVEPAVPAPQPLVECEEGADCDIAVTEPMPMPVDGEFFRPEYLVSVRGADGEWVSQRISDLLPDAGFVEAIVVFDGAFHLFVAPDYALLEEQFAQLGEDATDEQYEAIERQFSEAGIRRLILQP